MNCSNNDRKLLLETRQLSKSFGGNIVLNGVDLQLREGEIVLLQGDNGSGKTTLLNILTGNLEPDSGTIIAYNDKEERFVFPRPWWRHLLPFTYFSPERFARERLGRTWQDVRLFSTQPLRDNIAAATPNQPGENPLVALFNPRISNRFEKLNADSANQLLETLGLQGREESSANKISLGQAKRVAIARAVQAGAKILFLDEPLSGLDKAGIDSVLEMLLKLAKEQNITLVIVEHSLNIPRIKAIASTVWTLSSGELSINKIEEKTQKSGLSLLNWLQSLADDKSRFTTTELPNGARLSVLERSGLKKKALQISGITVSRGNRTVVEQPLSIELSEGDISILEAPNGWGKSTLFDIISGILPCQTGKIFINSIEYTNKPIWQRARAGLFLSRSQNTLFPHLSVRENQQLYNNSELSSDDKQSRTVGSLSGGESRRLSVECALNNPAANILLLDEPFQALDVEMEQRVRILIESAENKTILISVPKTTEI